jgi:Holliday junction resolvasome RuvABC endonuclease subunit
MNVLGLDLSLTSSGFAYRDDAGEIHTGIITPKSHKGLPRLLYVWNCIEHIVHAQGTDKVVIEGYSMGRFQMQRAHSTGEMGGLVKVMLWKKGIPILIVSPKGLKKFATGNGNSTKPQVQGHIMTRWGYRVEQEDEADAFVLMHAGEAYWNPRRARNYDPKRREALEKFELIRPGWIRDIH